MSRSVLVSAIAILFAGNVSADEAAVARIDAPAFALEGVPVARVRIEVIADQPDRPSGGDTAVRVEGIVVTEPAGPLDAAELSGLWDGNVLTLATDHAAGRKVLITDDDIRVTLPDGRVARHAVRTVPGWVSLLPAAVAIVLAIGLRDVLVALFAAVWCGMTLFSAADGNWLLETARGFIETVDTALVRQLVPADGDGAHMQIILFILFLGCLIGVMSASGGTTALVRGLSPLTRTRRGGQVTTCLLGLVVFFDDYANSLLLGSTMRPVTDRLKISREKLAFLVDATAAPVAGLAVVSTWVAFEVGLIGDSFARLAAANPSVATSGDAYATFLATLPYRFYPLFLLAFVFMIAWTGRDFGAMRRAEQRARSGDRPTAERAKPQALVGTGRAMDDGEDKSADTGTEAGTLWNAVVPLGILLAGIVIGFWMTGRGGVDVASPSLWQIVGSADSNRVLLVSSFVASATAVVMAIASGSLSLTAAMAAWLDGARSMLLGAAILVLAWAIAMVCDADHLNTAGYLVELSTGRVNSAWMPAVSFLLSAGVSFATGSSWATMGLLIPLVISVTYGLMAGDPSLAADAMIDRQPLMLASVGGVLAGSIFGDHCSPISDTTVLSSVAADCDHLAHVTTQFPYALSVGFVALAVGGVPVGFGVPWMVSLPLGLLACALIVRLASDPTGPPLR